MSRQGSSGSPLLCQERVIAKCKRSIKNGLNFFFIGYQSACEKRENLATAMVFGVSGKERDNRANWKLDGALP